MDYLTTGLSQAIKLLLSLDQELWGIVGRSLLVSCGAVSLAGIIAIPIGALLALTEDKWYKRFLMTLTNAFMGLPPVVVGLIIYLVLTRRGLLGGWEVLFTLKAMVIVQLILALPILMSITHSSIKAVDPGIQDAAKTLGASPLQVSLAVMREARQGIVVAMAAGLGRVLAEVGAVMLVGGNIAGKTRVMTTAIVLETRKGNFALALGLGLVLILLSVGLNIVINVLGNGRLKALE